MRHQPDHHPISAQEQTFIGLSDRELRDLLDLGCSSPYAPEQAPQLPQELTPFQQEMMDSGRGAELILGPYVLQSRLGAGGMGVVYRALHLRMGRPAALKVLAPELTQDQQAISRFLREVRAISRLRHPNIVTAFDAQMNEQDHYLAMELVDGADLDQIVMNQGPFSVPEAAEIIRQAASALECVHREGMVHRDIKPSNLMLELTGQIKVTDFGLAKLGCAQSTGDTGLTHPGVIMGSIDYLAPEQARDSRIATPAADIYSLGCTLGFLLTGSPPFRGSNIIETLTAHQTQPPPSLMAIRPDVPRGLNRIYQQMLAKDPQRRPASMAEVAQRLQKYLVNPKPSWYLRRRLSRRLASPSSTAETLAIPKQGTTDSGLFQSRLLGMRKDSVSKSSILHSFEYSQLPTFQEWLLIACIIAACLALSLT